MPLPPPARRPPPARPPAEVPAEPEADARRVRFVAPGGTGSPAAAPSSGRPPTAAWRESAEVREERARRAEAVARRALRAARRRSIVLLILLGGLAYLFGWGARNEGWVPGVFLASDIGLPVVLVVALQGVARVMRAGIRDPLHARAAATVARGAAWSLGSFWALLTITTVPQLAIGLAVAIFAFALFWARDRRAGAGYVGYGPALGPSVVLVLAYPAWLLVSLPFGPMPFFDVLSLVAVFLLAFAALSKACAAALRADAVQPQPTVVQAARDEATRAARSRHLVVAIVIGYLVFTFVISPALPYGPVVEWFIVALAPLFFALLAASRIGTVPTRRALPPAEIRTHQQRVFSLPDHHLAEVESRLASYVHANKEREWLHDHYERLLAGNMAADRYTPLLARLQGRRSTEASRRDLVAEMARVLEEAIPEREPRRRTDMLKTNPRVAEDGPSRSAASA